MKKYDRPLTPEEIANLKDEDIDFSDIPELGEDFWRHAELIRPDVADTRPSKDSERSPAPEHGFVKDKPPSDEPSFF